MENDASALALKIAEHTGELLKQHRQSLTTEEQLDEFIGRAHREALQGIACPALRFRVAMILGYKGEA
jgi:hypothetical protein